MITETCRKFIPYGSVPETYLTGRQTLPLFYHTRKEDLIGSINKTPDIYDLINVILLRINDNAAIEDATLRILQIVCTRQIPGRQKLPLLRSMGIRIDEEIREGIEHMCNLSDWIESEAKKEGHLAGLEEGRLTGLQEGRLTGLEEGKILIINQLIRSGLLEESQVLPLLKMSSQEFQEKTKNFLRFPEGFSPKPSWVRKTGTPYLIKFRQPIRHFECVPSVRRQDFLRRSNLLLPFVHL